MSEKNTREPWTVRTLNTAKASIRFVSSFHYRGVNSKNTIQEIGPDTKILCLEGPFIYSAFRVNNNDNTGNLETVFGEILSNSQYSEILKSISVKKIYLTDVAVLPTIAEKIHKEESDFANLSIATAVGAAISATLMSGKYSRRGFLKILGLGGLGITTYFGLPLAKSLLMILGYDNDILKDVDEKNFKYTLWFRNLVMAHKIDFIVEKNFAETKSKSKIAACVGAMHIFLEKALRISRDDRHNFIVDVLSELKKEGKIIPAEYVWLLFSIFNIPLIEKDADGNLKYSLTKIPDDF